MTNTTQGFHPAGLLSQFRLCRELQELETLKKVLPVLLRHGCYATMLNDDRIYSTVHELEMLLERNYSDDRDPSTGKSLFGTRLFSTGFPVRMVDAPADTDWGAFTWAVHWDHDVRIEIIQTVNVTERDVAARQVRLGDRMLALSKEVYALARPVFGMLRDPDREGDPWRLSVMRRFDIVTLNSANFFGPEYVERYGRALFESIPRAQIEDLPDGGLLCKATTDIPIIDKLDREKWQAEVKVYLAQHGVHIHFEGPGD